MKLLDEFSKAEDLSISFACVHRDELLQVVSSGAVSDAGVGGRGLEPAPVLFSHVSPVRGEGLQEGLGWDDPELPVVLRVEDGVRPEGLSHVLVEVRREWQLRV